MAIVYAENTQVAIEPTLATPEFDFGPADRVASNAVLLTADNLRKVGAYACQAGHDWVGLCWVTQTVDTVPTALILTTLTLQGSYWDPVSREAVALTVAKPGGDGEVSITFADTGAHVAGMYRFLITATDPTPLTFDLFSGWLEILPGRPVP